MYNVLGVAYDLSYLYNSKYYHFNEINLFLLYSNARGKAMNIGGFFLYLITLNNGKVYSSHARFKQTTSSVKMQVSLESRWQIISKQLLVSYDHFLYIVYRKNGIRIYLRKTINSRIVMAENKKSFVLYCDLIHTIEKLPDDKAGLLLKHLLRYVNDQNPVTEDLIVDITFEPIKHQLKRDLIKYEGKKEQWSDAGKASAEARKLKKLNELQQNSTDVKSVATVSTVTDTDSVNVTDTVNDISIKENLTEFILNDLENSTHLEVVCKRTNLTIDQVKSSIPNFKQIANIEYPKPMDLVMHFIRWLKQNPPKDINSKPQMSW